MIKKLDYILWKSVVEMVSNKEHFFREGLEKIVAIKASINRGLANKLLEALSNVRPKDLITNKKILYPLWIAGFVSLEGCFMIKINKPIGNRISQALLAFQITHKRDELLMRSLIEYFSWKVYKRNDAYDFRVTKFSLITKIVPFLHSYP